MSKYANWLPKEELNKNLFRLSKKEEIDGSGVQLSSDEDAIYVDKSNGHTLVIGAPGSGKIQTIILPLINLSMFSGESMVVFDPKAELYKGCLGELNDLGYKTVLIDFDDPTKGNYWNPFDIIKHNFDKNKMGAEEMLETVANYLFSNSDVENDPFWKNSASDFFCGICSYLIEKKEKVTFDEVFKLADKLTNEQYCKNFLNDLDKGTSSYSYLVGTLKAPRETRNSIIAVFNSEINKIISNKYILTLLSKTDFDINDIFEKTAIFIVPSRHKKYNSLETILINELYDSLTIIDNKKKVNFILDKFDEISSINNLATLLNYAIGYNITFTCNIKSTSAVKELYKKQNLDLIKICFSNIVYLYSSDNNTLKFISELCGNVKDENGNIEPLVTVEELKVTKPMEAIVIKARYMPVRTKLIPAYRIDWGYEFGGGELPEKEDI